MFTLLPVIVFINLYLICRQRNSCWRSSVLTSAIIWGTLLAGITELLSLGKLLTLPWLVGIWSLIVITSFAYLVVTRRKIIQEISYTKLTNFLILLLCSIAFIVVVVGLTGVIAAPNNIDSLAYHLPRVVQWIQNQSLDFYPTSYLLELYQKPWAEFAIMHFQILSGGDHFANLVQWSAMVGSIIGVSLIAKQIGADLRGQVLASVVCVTIPMGVIQGSSTQNDYVVAFWLVCFVYYVLLAVQERKISNYSLQIGLSLGLAFLTKATAYLYAIPFYVFLLLSAINQYNWKFWRPILRISILVVLINISHEIRNIDLFGRPLASGEEKYTNDGFSLAIWVSNIMRNICLQIGIPKPLNSFVEHIVEILHNSITGLDVNDPRTTWGGQKFHIPVIGFQEDGAADPIQLLLVLATIILFIIRKDLRREKIILYYLISTISVFLIFCLVLRWQTWHSRLHLPIFVLFSAFVGLILGKLANYKIANSLALILIITSLPFVFCNTNRPLISKMNQIIEPPGNYRNIFNTSREEQYFQNPVINDLKTPYLGAVSFLKSVKCTKIGIYLPGDHIKYPLLLLLGGNPNQHVYQFQEVGVNNISAKKYKVYPYNKFIPCAIFVLNKPGIEPSIPEKSLKNVIDLKGDVVKKYSEANSDFEVSVFIAM